MKTMYEEIVNVSNIATKNGENDLHAIVKLAESESLPPAVDDAKKILLLSKSYRKNYMYLLQKFFCLKQAPNGPFFANLVSQE